jgi:hypothetical protein
MNIIRIVSMSLSKGKQDVPLDMKFRYLDKASIRYGGKALCRLGEFDLLIRLQGRPDAKETMPII